jgi:membrane protease YdiL (CAAX protease family)
MDERVKRLTPISATLVFVAALFGVWILAWLLKLSLDPRILWFTSEEGAFTYWLAAKLIIWVLPSVMFLRSLGIRFVDVLGVRNLKRALIWGGGIGLAILFINVLSKSFIFHKPILFDKTLFPFISAVIISPIVEEITFRGAVLNGLLSGLGFKSANALTAVFFLLIHLPGWYFQGDLAGHLTSPQAVAILLLGSVFGYIAMKSDSLIGPMIAHSLNNLTS